MNNKLIRLFIIIFFSFTLLTSNSISFEIDDNDVDNDYEYNIAINNTIIPPNPPNIEGPANCEVWGDCIYNFTISHPEDIRLISLFVIFGDGTNLTKNYKGTSCLKGWISGYTIGIKHKWKKSGDYSIRAKVKDYPGAWSDWGTLEITVLKEKDSNEFNSWLVRLKERLPILQYLL